MLRARAARDGVEIGDLAAEIVASAAVEHDDAAGTADPTRTGPRYAVEEPP